jgi:hypothetical protein
MPLILAIVHLRGDGHESALRRVIANGQSRLGHNRREREVIRKERNREIAVETQAS